MEMGAKKEGEKVVFSLKPLADQKPLWTYKIEDDHSIKIKKTEKI
jgi:hypothetical protein